MIDLWIRVDVSSSRDPKIAAFGKFLGISTAHAYGHLVMVWCAMAEHASDGVVADALEVLEAWADWRGEPGKFRQGFELLFVRDGEVSGYKERQGKLMEMRRRDRARKAPRKFHGTAEEIPSTRDVTRQEQERDKDQKQERVPRARARKPAVELEPVVQHAASRRAARGEYRRAVGRFVFGYWAQRLGHPAALLDAQRLKRIEARLEETGDDPRDLLYAIDGAQRDPWIMGTDSRSSTRHDGIETLFRERGQVERLAGLVPGWRAGAPHPTQSQLPARPEVVGNGALGGHDGSERRELPPMAAHEPERADPR